MSDDWAEREARARALREDIARLEQEADTPSAGAGEEDLPRPGESVNDFVQRRMRQLKKKQGGGEPPPTPP